MDQQVWKAQKVSLQSLGWSSAVFLALGLLAGGCVVPPEVTTAGNSTVTVLANPSPTPSTDPSKTVCDPLNSGGSSGSAAGGLVAELHYVPGANPSSYGGVHDLLQQTQKLDATLYFNQLYVPTRMFDRGFVNQNGETLVNDLGNKLYEYFVLRFQTQVRLGGLDDTGLYEFAILSDDGSVMDMDLGHGFETVVDNDGNHPTRLGCSTKVVDLSSRDKKISMKLDYYQGPRYHIALTVLFRKLNASGQAGSDAACGQLGNELFWDPSTDPSIATQNFKDLLARGWKVLGPDNYLAPNGNPCNSGGNTGGGSGGGIIGI